MLGLKGLFPELCRRFLDHVEARIDQAIRLIRRTTVSVFGPTKSSRLPFRRRWFVVERLESRRVLVAEGEVFSLQSIENVTSLAGTVTAHVEWGDGSSTTVVPSLAPPGPVRIRFDYSLDSFNFFDTSFKRQLLEQAADALVSRLTDSLNAIIPSGGNTWSQTLFHPATGDPHTVDNPRVEANELVVYVGGRPFSGDTTAQGGPGGYTARGSREFLDNVASRGELGTFANPPTDIAPWGGSIAFNTQTRFHFGETVVGLDRNEADFVSVALHEITHLLGFGVSDAFARHINTSNRTFSGPHSIAVHDAGGPVPLASDLGHWANSLTDGGQEAAMTTSLLNGTRKVLTELDFAALMDTGWEVTGRSVSIAATHVYPDDGVYSGRIVMTGSTGGELIQPFSASITNLPPTLTVVGPQTAFVGRPLSITDLGTISDPGFSNPNRIPPTSETFSYSIDWRDGSAASIGIAMIDRNGGVGTLTLASFDGEHTYTQPGRYSVVVSVADDNGGTATQQFEINVTVPVQTLSLTTRRLILSESGDTNSTEVRIERTSPIMNVDLVVSLLNSDSSELDVPATVLIPASQSSVSFTARAKNDGLLDGIQMVSLESTAPFYTSSRIVLSVVEDPFTWQNPVNSLDVSGDGQLSPIDALSIINDINEFGARQLPTPDFSRESPPFLDVSGDGITSSIDALLVINAINTGARLRAEAESNKRDGRKLEGMYDQWTPYVWELFDCRSKGR